MTIQQRWYCNELIATYLGYIYKYETSEDFSECGGLYTDCLVYSKIPLKITYESLDRENYQEGKRDKFFFVTLKGWNMGDHTELPYHLDWNVLMPIAKQVYEEVNKFVTSREDMRMALAEFDIERVWTVTVDYIHIINKNSEKELK